MQKGKTYLETLEILKGKAYEALVDCIKNQVPLVALEWLRVINELNSQLDNEDNELA